ncbi:hypothetical protein LNV09_24635, partial [Paucibacter sp. B2R-40]|nr:hypothetical protein [Paucibacter sp. B2R-40]
NLNANSTGALNLGTGTVGGNLVASSNGGAITQAAGGLSVTGTTSANAGAAAITLTEAANNFTGAVAVSNSGANSVAIRDANDVVLAASTVGANLDVASGGHITQVATTGVLTVGGTSTFTVDTGTSKDVLLAGASNDLAGLVSINTVNGASLRDVGLKNTNASAVVPPLPSGLRNLDIQLSNAAVVLPSLSLSGNLNITSGAAVSQTGTLTITGTSTITATGSNVTLTDSANNFGGTATITGAGISLRDVGA